MYATCTRCAFNCLWSSSTLLRRASMYCSSFSRRLSISELISSSWLCIVSCRSCAIPEGCRMMHQAGGGCPSEGGDDDFDY